MNTIHKIPVDNFVNALEKLYAIKTKLSSMRGATPEMWEALATAYDQIDAPANAAVCREHAEALRKQEVG